MPDKNADDGYDREEARARALERDDKARDAARRMRDEEKRERAELAHYEREEQREASGRKRRRKSLDPRTRREVLDQLFYEGDETLPYIYRFATLLALSVIIATLGLLVDSTAVVIGAMLIAPLMTPILAIAAALVMGWPRRQLWMLGFVVAASLAAVGIAFLVAMITVSDRQTTLTPEILSRTTPNLLDLFIGLAAGAAGAYVLVRKEAVSALPGVAVAVALVPPISTVGVLLWFQNWSLLWSSLLLYATNLVTIVLAAAGVLLVMGFKPRVRDETLSRRVRLGVASAVIGVVIVGIPLGIRGYNEFEAQLAKTRVSNAVDELIKDEPELTLEAVQIDNDLVVLDFIVDVPFAQVGIGSGDSATAQELEEADSQLDDSIQALQSTVVDALGRDVDVTARGLARLVDSTCESYRDCDPDRTLIR